VASSGATAETACPAGRYSGTGASHCDLCPVGTTNDAGEAACTTVDAGFFADLPELFQLTIRSSVLLDGVDASAFNDDAEANAQLKTALEATLVADPFTVMMDSAAIAAVGPATAVGASVQIAFELVANYSAPAGENVDVAQAHLLEDFELDLAKKLSDGTLQRNIDEAVSPGRRVLRASRRSLSESTLASATVNA
jgi:hypothetical protein